MGMVKLRRWPFETNETAEVCWFGSIFMGTKGNWRINVAFRRSGKPIQIVDYPVGIWPMLRLGQQYTNGVFDLTGTNTGIVETIQISDVRQGKLVFGFDVPSKLLFLDKNRDLGKQFVWKYEIGDTEFYVPVMEWMRCLYVKNRTLAYLMLIPHGLDLIIENVKQNDESLYIDFNRRLPVTLAQKKDNVLHISWIYSNEKIRNSWDSIYNYIMRYAIKKDPADPRSIYCEGIALKFDLPSLEPCEMMVRCVRKGNQTLIQEIIGISNLNLPAEKLVYSHPLLKKQLAVDGPKKTRITETDENEEDVAITEENEPAKENPYQDVLDVPPTFFGFVNKPEIIIHRKGRQTVNTGEETIIPLGRGGKNKGEGPKEVSAEDTMAGTGTPPIEFESLQTVPVSEGIGLEDFFKVIHKLVHDYGLQIKMSIVQLPLGKRYSILENGVRRTCAIAQVTTMISQKYIIEMARPDSWSISTLILTNANKINSIEIEKNFRFLLEEVVSKGGHWDQYMFYHCALSIQKQKHYQNDDLDAWADRLYQKVMSD